jgi:hypothetical protein
MVAYHGSEQKASVSKIEDLSKHDVETTVLQCLNMKRGHEQVSRVGKKGMAGVKTERRKDR